MRKQLILACAVSLSACATKPVSDTAAVPAPAERVFMYQSAVPDGGKLVVTRDVGLSGSACDIGIMVDGQDVARLRTGERATFNLPAGEVTLGAKPVGSGLCSIGTDRLRRETGLIIKTGLVRKYRIGLGYSGEPVIAPTTY
ncbi:hypothetical protein [Xanthomonas euvesicatoria]|uniref:hypothetical protein n=1 Tax=Xanthomonas euvesicatoria TaxID=456327 RepID=UPI001C440646|nr:hypothetical protein [Xanthomonas euvesicatoria]MBV6872164.1 hypothetical protein [Xanthomonas campestris pv. veroniae]